jgi:hypothetical protein
MEAAMTYAQQVTSDDPPKRGRPVEHKEPRTALTVRIPVGLSERLAQLALKAKTPISTFATTALQDLYDSHPLKPVVERMLAAGAESEPPPKPRRK